MIYKFIYLFSITTQSAILLPQNTLQRSTVTLKKRDGQILNTEIVKYLRWLDTVLHTSFRTSGNPHKPSRDFSMLAWPFTMLYSLFLHHACDLLMPTRGFCVTRANCWSQQKLHFSKYKAVYFVILSGDLCWNVA